MEGPELYRTLSLGQREELRTTKLLNARERTIGIDVGGLDGQVAEKAYLRAELAERDAAQNKLASTNLAVSNVMAAETEKERRTRLASTVAAWDTQKDRTLRREWDLSDPAQVTKATLPRNTGPLYETRDFGHPSALQVFNAELLEDPSINVEKRRVLLEGLATGVDEHVKIRADDSVYLAETRNTMRLNTDAAAAVADATARQRAANLYNTVGTNQTLHSNRLEREEKDRDAHDRAARQHVDHELHNSFLREDTRMAVSATSPHRVRPDHFKGFSKAHVEHIYGELDRFAEEKQTIRVLEAKHKREEEAVAVANLKAADAVFNATDKEKTLRMKQYYADLAVAAQEKRDRDAKSRAEDRSRQYPTATGILAGFGRSLK